MPTKTVVISLIAIAVVVIVFVLARDTQDQAIVDQLARQQELSAPEVSLQATSTDLQPNLFNLTNNLTAEKQDESGYWMIEPKQGSSFVRLPFPPTMDGSFPGSEQTDEASTPDSNPGFVGAQACRECHQTKHDGFIHTAHHKTSGLLEPSNVRGAFSQPRNVLKTGDTSPYFTMSERDGKYFQKVKFADWSMDVPLDVFTGSAKAGQTFLYWHHDALFQCFVSYLSALDAWIPSPGYRGTTVEYAHVIRTGCLECHITYIDQKRRPNVYHRDSAVWGISCERCHGPGRDHVQYHQHHPNEKTSKYIVQPRDLPRERQLDICGQCHAGSFALIGDAFSYRPGDELAKFHKLLNPDFKGVGGIHTSNQLTRLSMSKCFQKSEMTCTTCHNPHENQRGDLAVFTKSCLNCHQPDHCGMSEELGDRITDNCISCHMPIGDNERMTLQLSSGTFSLSMIDHYIRIDKKATTEQMAK